VMRRALLIVNMKASANCKKNEINSQIHKLS
jgi:hypothetical protein